MKKEDIFLNSYHSPENKRKLLEQLLQEKLVIHSRSKITRHTISEPLPLSFAQQRLWFLDQLHPGSPLYHIPLVIHLKGKMEAELLERSFNEVIRRHEALRTVFVEEQGHPRQLIVPMLYLPLPVIQLNAFEPELQQQEVTWLSREEAMRPFSLSQGPLLRTILLELGERDHMLLFTVHHIVFDGWSMGVLWKELSSLYESALRGDPSPLPELPVQYKDYTLWQLHWVQEANFDRQLAYWHKQLKGIPTRLELPTDHPRPIRQNYSGARQPFTLAPSLVEGLRSLSREENTTLSMTLLAAFQILLSRYTGQEDLVVGLPFAGRTIEEIEGLIGFFVNTLALRADLSGRPSFRNLLKQVQQTALDAYSHPDVPFERLVEELQPERDSRTSPLIQVMFAPQNTFRETLSLSGLTVQINDGETGTAKFDLTVELQETDTVVEGVIEYNTSLFEPPTIGRLIEHWRTLLEHIVQDPEQSIALLPLLTSVERNQILMDWNDTQTSYPVDATIHSLFEEQVQRTPKAVAVVFEDHQLTYEQLNAHTNRLAGQLQTLGVKPEVRVGICMERSLELIIGILAILKAGGAYLPLDPHYPHKRLTFILEDTGVSLLLVHSKSPTHILADQAQLISLDGVAKQPVDLSLPNPISHTRSANLAYVMYTSGSTGTPKGVMIEHRNVVRLVKNTNYVHISSKDIFLQFAPSSFDASTFEIWGSLLNGAKLVVFPAYIPSLEELAHVVLQQGITILWLTSGLFHLMVNHQISGLRHVRQLLAGGDVLSVADVQKAVQELPHCIVINGYGPTENTTFSCCYSVTDLNQVTSTIPIGKPIANSQAYLLDQAQQLVPIGVPGELYVGGAGVAREYLNRPELTINKFVPDPFSKDKGARLYRTGDLASYLPNGDIKFLRRIDQQVKIRGFRIEPKEIEVVLGTHEAVQEALVITRTEASGDKSLVAYLTLKPGPLLTPHEVRKYVQSQLPDYMVPSVCVILEAFPLTINGKVDRQALPAPTQQGNEAAGDFLIESRTSTEQLLVEIWADILKVERVGVGDNFFELGGHSLLATQVISRVREVFQLELPLRVLFEFPTIELFAQQINVFREKIEGVRIPPLLPAQGLQEYPLSFPQDAMVRFLKGWKDDKQFYNMFEAIRLRGPLNVDALERVCSEIVKRHAVFRTRFLEKNGRLIQRISPEEALHFSVVDLDNFPDEQRETQTLRLAIAEAQMPFDLSKDHLLRVKVISIGEKEHVLLLSTHHMISDGWSMGLLLQEFSILYEAYLHGIVSPLPKLPIQYADYALWQRQWLQGDNLEKQLAYWVKQLEGCSLALQMPIDRFRQEVPTFRGASTSLVLSSTMTNDIKKLCRSESITLFMLLFAAFNVLLYHYSGQSDIVVGTAIANRNRREIEKLIGYFSNSLLLRTHISGSSTFRSFLRQVRDTTLEAYAHQEIHFEEITKRIKFDQSYNVKFSLQDTPVSQQNALRFSEIQTQPFPVPQNATFKRDLNVDVRHERDRLTISALYSTDLFKADFIARLLTNYEVLLNQIIVDPGQRLLSLCEVLEDVI